MPQQIEIIGQGTVEFPDEMTPDEIKGVLKNRPPSFQAPVAQANEVVPERPSAVAVESGQASPDLGHITRTAGEALSETAAGFIPKSLGEILGFVTPVVGAVQDVGRGYGMLKDVLFGKPIDEATAQNFPETQIIPQAEETPPFSKERFKAGFDVLGQLGMAALGGRGLMKTLTPEALPQTPEATISDVAQQQPKPIEPTAPEPQPVPEAVAPVTTPMRPIELRTPTEPVGTSMEGEPIHAPEVHGVIWREPSGMYRLSTGDEYAVRQHQDFDTLAEAQDAAQSVGLTHPDKGWFTSEKLPLTQKQEGKIESVQETGTTRTGESGTLPTVQPTGIAATGGDLLREGRTESEGGIQRTKTGEIVSPVSEAPVSTTGSGIQKESAQPLPKTTTEPAAEVVGQEGQVEPWQVTKDEYHDSRLDDVIDRRKYPHWSEEKKSQFGLPRDPDTVHQASVEKAIKEGKPVPPEVLADYPELTSRVPSAPEATTAPLSPKESVTVPQPEQPVVPPEKVQSGEFKEKGYTAVSTEGATGVPESRGISEARTEAELGKGSVEPGVGSELGSGLEHGRDYINKGGDPRLPIRRAQTSGLVGKNEVGIVHAELERLRGVRSDVAKALEDDPANPDLQQQFTEADNAQRAWRKELQPVLTKSSDALREAYAISTPEVDPATYQGLADLFDEHFRGTRDISPEMRTKMAKAAKGVKDTRAIANGEMVKIEETLTSKIKGRKVMTPEELDADLKGEIMNQFKDCFLNV